MKNELTNWKTISSNWRTNRSDGFTLIELLVVIVIIAVLIALLLPAVQVSRELIAKFEAARNLEKASKIAEIFHDQNGRFPESTNELKKFCEVHPELCDDPPPFAFGINNGYEFFVIKSGENGWSVEAEPICPGITGAETLILEQNRSLRGEFVSHLRNLPTPGADKARQEAFANLRAEGGRTIAELLMLDPSAIPEVQRFSESPGTFEQVFNRFDANADQQVTVEEIQNFETRNFDPELATRLKGFLNFVSQELKFDALSDEMKNQATVGLSDFQTTTPEIFSYDSLCYLTERYTDEKKVAHRLCATLKAAESAEIRGDPQSKEKFTNRFIEQIEEQTHVTLTRKNAVRLIFLAKTL